MVEAYITPEVLTWARERRQLDVVTLSRGVVSPPETIFAWESGEARPTFKQAQRLAGRLRVPFGYLFLSEPPALLPQIPDLRRTGDGPPLSVSPDFVDLLNDVLTKQQWFREYKQGQGEEALEFVGKYKNSDAVGEVATDIRATLGINNAMRRRALNWEAFIRELIDSAEGAGLLVLRSGVVENNTHRPLDVEEFRGFAISDDLAPLVFINSRDYKAAQIFTLAHELAHLWIGESGISNPDYRLRSGEQGNAVERRCNRIAAEMLVPTDDFLGRWRSGEALQAQTQALARHYKVSTMVILKHAYEAGVVASTEYWQQYDALLAQLAARNSLQAEDGGGNAYATYLARNSKALTTAVLESVAEGTTLHGEAAHLLNVRVGTLDGLARHLIGERSNLA